MQSAVKILTRLYSSRLVRRALCCAVISALLFYAGAYSIINNAEAEAKHRFELTRQELVASSLDRAGAADPPPGENGRPEYFESELRQLLAHGQLAYLMILDVDGSTVAQVDSGFQPGEAQFLAGAAGAVVGLPLREFVSLSDGLYLNNVIELPNTRGLRAVYGIDGKSYSDVGCGPAGVLRRVLLLGGVALLLMLFFITFYFVRPLHRMLEDDAPAQSGLAGRKDELGEVWRMVLGLRGVKRADEARVENAVKERTKDILKLNEKLRGENAERRAIEQALVRAESRYREIVNNSSEGIMQRTADGRILSANVSMARILGYSSVEELLDAYQKPGSRVCHTSEMEFTLTEMLDVRGWVSNLEFQACMRDGNPVWVSMNARRVAGSAGETLYYEAFIEDIASRKKTEAKLVYQAFHDSLTGLPNRALFLDRLEMAMRRSKRSSEHLFAVLYLDLDRFKNINDSFGHNEGDKILTQVAEKLLQCVRDVDTVARFGGDEFAVLLAEMERPAQAMLVARRISAAMSETVNLHGQDVGVGASIGIVLGNHEYATPEDILRDADTAMYRAKMQGRCGYTVFNTRMREENIAAMALESDLHGAVERGEIEAFYQPLIDMETGEITGFESLMRWRRDGNIVSPAVFIPIAEETGLIYDVGLEMIRIVCAQMAEWARSMARCDFEVHVNISGKQLMARNFWRDTRKIFNETGVNPRQIIFEITESVLLDYGSKVVAIMNMIRDSGIRFCLDDFGTGFSSLSYLRVLPLEVLKLDRSFIVGINTDKCSAAILRNLISLGHDLGLKIIIEGVDQNEQVEILRLAGGRYAQGFLFARPMPLPDAVEYVRLRGTAC